MTQLLIVIATADPTFARLVESRKGAVIPEPFRRKGYERLRGTQPVVSCFCATGQTNMGQLLSFIQERISDKTQGILLIAERAITNIIPPLSGICFLYTHDLPHPLNSPLNYATKLLSHALGAYESYLIRFDDQKYRKLFILPLRNFHAGELNALRKVCESPSGVADFRKTLDQALSALHGRQRPKRYEDSDGTVYLVDDDGKHFAYGMEVHARADTKEPPHNLICRLANEFRFGRRFDSLHHFNVSFDGERISGEFPDCHGATALVTKQGKTVAKTHINMFSNDFFC